MIFGRRRQKSSLFGSNHVLGIPTSAFGIDLGTGNFKIYGSREGRIQVQKNMIAIQNKKTMIAYGDDAYSMYEKAPSNISITHPMSNGVIADINNMELLTKTFVTNAQRGTLHAADFFITIPMDVTEVERRAFCDLIYESGVKAKNVFAVEKAIADGLGLGLDVRNSQGLLIVDVGFDTTEISVLSQGGIVLSKILKMGGNVFNNTLVTSVRREYGLVIGKKTAESMRLAFNEQDIDTYTIYGRDIVTGLPRTRTIDKDFAFAALKENIRYIVDNVKTLLDRTPPELSRNIYREGLFLTGGASLQNGLAAWLERDLRLEVNMAEEPVNTAALGLAQVINKIQYRQFAYTIEGLNK